MSSHGIVEEPRSVILSRGDSAPGRHVSVAIPRDMFGCHNKEQVDRGQDLVAPRPTRWRWPYHKELPSPKCQ